MNNIIYEGDTMAEIRQLHDAVNEIIDYLEHNRKHGVTLTMPKGKPRGRESVLARRNAVRKLVLRGYSQRQIQKHLGFKSHASVEKHIAALRKTKQL